MSHRVNTIAIGGFAVWCMLTVLHAQEIKKPGADAQRPADARVTTDIKGERGKPAHVVLHRASEIHGMQVRNTANKELGTIKDTIVDVRPGMIKYAALSYGGFLGLGDKVFAVPWDALQHRHNVSSGDSYFVLDVDEATLKRSEGFDDSNWPNFTDPQFTGKIDTFYQKFRKPRHDANHQSNLSAARKDQVATSASAKTDNQKSGNAIATDQSAEPLMLRGSVLVGMQVKNEAQKELGKVDDLVIEVNEGKIRYAALTYGGFLGLGDKLFAVPWKAFVFRHDISDKEMSLVLNMDETHLRKAKGFDQDKWPNFADPGITRELDTYYNVSADRAANEGTTGGAIIRDRKDR